MKTQVKKFGQFVNEANYAAAPMGRSLHLAQDFEEIQTSMGGETEYGYELFRTLQSGNDTVATLTLDQNTGMYEVVITKGAKEVTFSFEDEEDANLMLDLLIKK